MEREIITNIQITENNELLLQLYSKGKSMYQHVYREAAGVYWDNELHGFKSTSLKDDWACPQWFFHIVEITKSVGVNLQLDKNATWQGIPEKDKNEIIEKTKIDE